MTLLTPEDISKIVQLPRRYTLDLIRSAGFPAPVIDMSQKMRRWTQESIEQWIIKQQKLNNR